MPVVKWLVMKILIFFDEYLVFFYFVFHLLTSVMLPISPGSFDFLIKKNKQLDINFYDLQSIGKERERKVEP